MASAAVDPAQAGGQRAGNAKVALGVGLPLLFTAAAYCLWWISDQLVVIGPVDRATFGWIVVVPLWLLAPVVAGFSWTTFSAPETRLAALIVGATVAAGTALVYWQSIGTPFDCGFGTVTPPIDFLPQTLFVGVIVGGGLALDGLLVARLVRLGVRWWAVIVGVLTELLMLALAFIAILATWEGHTCFLPPPA